MGAKTKFSEASWKILSIGYCTACSVLSFIFSLTLFFVLKFNI
ncbi:hypothetical protein AmDm5_0872 [Acetobacter malorum]|nr:hypothetical protein AmDm5_0872 [Acetobacter malorum]